MRGERERERMILREQARQYAEMRERMCEGERMNRDSENVIENLSQRQR